MPTKKPVSTRSSYLLPPAPMKSRSGIEYRHRERVSKVNPAVRKWKPRPRTKRSNNVLPELHRAGKHISIIQSEKQTNAATNHSRTHVGTFRKSNRIDE